MNRRLSGEIYSNMRRIESAGRAASLVIELSSGTAIVHGEEIELPLREFRLLATLAQRAGEPVATQELVKAVWPDDAEWTAKEDLYVLVSKLRRQIDGDEEFGKNIRNRRGFGYVLDVEPSGIAVVESRKEIPDLVPEGETEVPHLEARPTEIRPAADVATANLKSSDVTPERTARLHRLVTRAAIVMALLGGSWAAGYALASINASQAAPESEVQAAPDLHDSFPSQQDEAPEGASGNGKRGSKAKNGNGSKPSESPGSAGSTTGPSPENSATSGQAQGDSQGSGKGSKKKPPPTQEQLPPAPTRYLYHLFNGQTGDHFVTTDGGTASEYEAKGYAGGAIGRVYTSPEKDTKAVATDHGTAYIFINSSPKTEPASQTRALWYSTNDEGDFFYTTREDEAKQSGWSAHVIGYMRSL